MLVDSLEALPEALRYLDQQPELVVDTETTGLRLWHGDRVCGIAIEGDGRSFYFPFRHREGANLPMSAMKHFRKLLSKPDVEYVGFHYKFDLLALHQDGVPFPKRIQDAQLAAHLLNENETDPAGTSTIPVFALKPLSEKYLGKSAGDANRRLEEKLKGLGLGKGDMWKLPASEVAEYAETDVQITRRLRDFQYPHLEKWKLDGIWWEVNEYALALAGMERLGIQIDRDAIERNRAHAAVRAEEVRRELGDLVGDPKVNPRSAPQMQRHLGLSSTKADLLDQILLREPDSERSRVIRKLQEAREWADVDSKYYKAWSAWWDKDGVIHCNFNMARVISGRLSVSNPNMQAVPHVAEIGSAMGEVKRTIVARPGFVLAELDYSQAELRWLCHYTQDAGMRDLFLSGEDFHGGTAKAMGLVRDDAKRINFGIAYGLGAKGLSEKTGRSIPEAKSILDQYHRNRPGIKRLYYAAQERAETRKYIRLWTGRMRHYNTPWAEPHKAMSNLIQGAVAEMIRVAIVRVAQRFESDPSVRMLHQVHDSLLFELPEDRVGEIVPEIKTIMEDFDLFVPVKVDVKIGKTWGDAEKWG